MPYITWNMNQQWWADMQLDNKTKELKYAKQTAFCCTTAAVLVNYWHWKQWEVTKTFKFDSIHLHISNCTFYLLVHNRHLILKSVIFINYCRVIAPGCHGWYFRMKAMLHILKQLDTFATSDSMVLHHNTLTHISPNGYHRQGKTTQVVNAT